MSAVVDGRLRVLHIARSYPNNVIDTLGMWTHWLVRGVAEHCDVRVFSPVPWCPPLPRVERLQTYTRFRDVARKETRDGIHIEHPRFALSPANTLPCIEHRTYHRALTRPVDELRKTFPFDLIHAHFIYPDGVAAARLAQRYDVPYLVTDQAPWHPWLERECVRKAALPAARSASRLVAVSGYLRDTMRRYLPAEIDVDVIPNGVDATAFAAPLTNGRRTDQIAYVGLINFNKGIDTLLHAMQKIVARNEQARLVLVGGSYYRNTQLQEERLRQLAVDLGLNGHVTFAGRRAPDEVAAVMRESAVVVLPSRAETFGAVLVEALASGTPVVSTESGGPQEIVTDAVGRLVPVDNAEALADALGAVLAAPGRYDAATLRSYALDRFSWSSIAERYVDLYRDACSVAAA